MGELQAGNILLYRMAKSWKEGTSGWNVRESDFSVRLCWFAVLVNTIFLLLNLKL